MTLYEFGFEMSLVSAKSTWQPTGTHWVEAQSEELARQAATRELESQFNSSDGTVSALLLSLDLVATREIA